jgi:hypothetical protein
VVADIAKLSVGREAYYTRELAENHEEYLSGHGESPGRWYGAGASSLGLEGEASVAGFQAMFEGVGGLVTSSLTASRSSWAPMAALTRWGLRPVATTASPAVRAALAMSTPIPRPAPVMNQVFLSVTLSSSRSLPKLATPGQASGGDRHLMFCEVRDNLARLTTSGLERADTRPSWREPRSPATPRVEGSGRTVLACPTPSRKRRRPTRHPSQLGRVEEGLQQLDGQQHLGQPQGPGPGPLHRLAAAAAARRSG